MRHPTSLFFGATLATAVMLTACTAGPAPDGGTSASPAAEVTIGIVTSETGPLAGYAKQYVDGFTAGLSYATDGTSQVGDTSIVVQHKDDAGDPAQAVAAVNEFADNGVSIVVGSASSDVALAVAAQAEQRKMLFVSGSADADAITGLNDHTFRSGSQSSQAVATAGAMLDGVNGKSAMVLAQDSAAGQAYAAEVDTVLGGEGATVTPILIAADATDFVPYAQQVQADAPDLLVVAWNGESAGALWQALARQGVLDNLPVVTALEDASTFGSFGEASEKLSFTNHYFPGAPDNDVNSSMIGLIEGAGGTPDLYSPDGFNAAVMLVHAISEGGTSVDAMIGSLEGFRFDGPKGAMSIRASDHALLQDMYRVKLVAKDGQYTPELVATVPADAVAPAETK